MYVTKLDGNNSLKVFIKGRFTLVRIPGNLQTAHGIGLDGTTVVKSLKIGKSPEHPDNLFVQDVEKNSMVTTPDELIAALRLAAPGYKITATKITD